MRTLQEKLVKFFKSEDGPTAVEYAVMVALIIVVAISAITVLGEKTSGVFTATASAIQ
ncbi:MAG: Flp family type IVb pilin [Planctomycetota bacterium]|jgi:pilus assembly protein Flp/PilA|nr:MAG: Flp family type IVb pilin [Planctomycetota bacterium]